jgi:hypothetical protein
MNPYPAATSAATIAAATIAASAPAVASSSIPFCGSMREIFDLTLPLATAQ